MEEQLDYLEDFDLDISKSALLEKLGNFAEAAKIHLEKGRTLQAINLFLMNPNDTISIQSGISCILRGLWEKISFGMHDINKIDGVSELLNLASKTGASNIVETSVADEVSSLLAIFFTSNDTVAAVINVPTDQIS